jgi:hypothetical protein
MHDQAGLQTLELAGMLQPTYLGTSQRSSIPFDSI